jgi:hypothetical protein
MKLVYPLHIQRVIQRLSSERPAANSPEYMNWVCDVRQYAKRYMKQYLSFDVPAFYRACGISSLKGLSLKSKRGG